MGNLPSLGIINRVDSSMHTFDWLKLMFDGYTGQACLMGNPNGFFASFRVILYSISCLLRQFISLYESTTSTKWNTIEKFNWNIGNWQLLQISRRIFNLTNLLKTNFIPSNDNKRLFQNFIFGATISICLYFTSLVLLHIPGISVSHEIFWLPLCYILIMDRFSRDNKLQSASKRR